MFSLTKIKIALAIYVFIVISIPIGAYSLSQQQIFKTRADQPKKPKVATEATPSATASAAKQLQRLSEPKSTTKLTPTPEPALPTTATSFGPTLSLTAILEGRPVLNQATRLFVGIVEGILVNNPKFLLSFTVDLPASGEFSNLSLAGLTPNSSYTALLKGPAQIATSSAFLMNPTVTNLNGGNPLTLLSGDLNEDNTVNTSDYAIVKSSLGSTPQSQNWQENADFNKDGIINTLDLSLVIKNMGKTGASGSWVSPLPTATSSGSLTPQPNQGGYWLWIPQ